jgi:hypothetical protein
LCAEIQKAASPRAAVAKLAEQRRDGRAVELS